VTVASYVGGVILVLLLSAFSVLKADEFPMPVNTEPSDSLPLAPSEAARTATLPEGFQLTVIAAEPVVQNPIAFTFDERGRLWVAENYSWAGGRAGGFDGAQRDRLVILEDADADGTFEKRTVFWDKAQRLTSVEIGDGGVWALCLPNLVFIPDRNRDDIPDSEPEIVLDGFDVQAIAHNAANGLRWGPDGWLYGRHGILATSSIGKPGSSESQRFQINTGVWRYHPRSGAAEAVLHGMTNAWGFDFDKHGQMFVINTVIGHLWHVIPGAHTQRMFGLDMSPHSYRLIEQVADHVHWDAGEVWNDVRKGVTDRTSAAGGGHAHTGLMIYQGDNWPEEYRDRVYMINFHGRRLNCDFLKRKGAGYTATHGADLCFVQDPWFRGMDLLSGPDGAVYLTDWSDTGECHDHDGVHRTSGRIYKLAYGTAAVPTFDLSKQSDQQLIALLGHRNTWWARQARRLLGDRAAADTAVSAEIGSALRKQLATQTDPVHRLRILEAIHETRTGEEGFWLERLRSADEHERVTALRFLTDQLVIEGRAPSPAFLKSITELAEKKSPGLDHLYAASALQRMPLEQRWDLATKLASHPDLANDPVLPLMVWYGIEPAVPHDPARALSLVKASQMPVLTECLARRLTLEIESDPASVDQLVQLAVDSRCPHRESILAGMALALNGWQKATPPAGWTAVAKAFAASPSAETRKHLQDLNVVFGDGRALEDLRKLIIDDKLPLDSRRQALRSLLASHPAGYVPTLLNLLSDRGMSGAALHGLAQYDDPQIPARVLARLPTYGPQEREEMIRTLASRPTFVPALLAAIREKKISPQELSAFYARQIQSYNDPVLTKELTELWGEIRVSPTQKRELIEQHRSRLTTEAFAQADPSEGRALFQKTCASCHVLYGVGRRLGPDLTGSNRKNLDYLLENILDPSATVGAGFRAVIVALDDGRVLNGVISEQNDRTLTLQTAQEPVILDRRTIEAMKPTNLSLMPDGLLQKMSREQVRDLISYLMSTDQVALPAGP
jgi:putative membrane-bound dehydrogenase-like protein